MTTDTLELIIEHFEFAPISVIDDVIDSVNELLYQALIGLENFIAKYLNFEEEIEQVTYTYIINNNNNSTNNSNDSINFNKRGCIKWKRY